MRKTGIAIYSLLSLTLLSACAGGNTGIALGYGHHGPGFAIYTDNLWFTPQQAGVSVPLGWESGSYSHVPAAPATPAVTAVPADASAPAPANPVAAGPLTGYAAPARLPAAKPLPQPTTAHTDATPAPAKLSGSGVPLGHTPSVLVPPDL